MSWAAVAKSATAPPAPTEAPAPRADERLAIVDTNAIISGLRLENLADRFCTIPEVIAEVRDSQSRTFLSTLPFTLDIREPDEESIKAVQRFARETGDIHSLSAVDLKLLALAHTLEVAAHGTAHLREHPVQVRTRQKHKSRPRALPGWGNVANPEDWKVVDEAPEELLTNAEGGQSRIIAAVQSLTLGDEAQAPAPVPAPTSTQLPAFAATHSGEAATSAGAAPALTSLPPPPPPATQASAVAEQPQGQGQQQQQQQAAAETEASLPQLGDQQQGPPLPAAADGEEDDEDEEEEDGGGWATVHKSRNAARRKQRKARRHQAWLEQQQQQQQQQPPQPAGDKAPVATTSSPAPAPPSVAEEAQQEPAATGAAAAGAASRQAAPEAGTEESGAGEDEEQDEGDGEDEDEGEEMEEVEGLELVTDEEASDGEEEGEGEDGGEERDGAASEAGTAVTGVTDGTATGTVGTATGTVGTATTAAPLTDADIQPNTTSNVFSVTADFAMQNVILQMGLRLVTRDGKQITRVNRWALRCSACFFVTKEAGRLFCPRCGNMTMDRVEVTVGPGGAEFYGVRKKYILRGTKFSLPKPKGGRHARRNPVLREDVMLARMGGKQRAGGGKAAPAGELDPFAPEYGSETWHQVTGGGRAGGRAGGRGAVGGVLLTSWKHNPNEVKPQRKSRRK